MFEKTSLYATQIDKTVKMLNLEIFTNAGGLWKVRFLLKSTFNSCKDKKKVIWCSPNYREPELRSRVLTKELALLTNQLTQDQYTVVIWGNQKFFLRLVATNTNIS